MDVSSHAKKKFTKTQDLSLALVEIVYVHECCPIRVHLVGCHVNCNSFLWLNVNFFYISNVASMEILCLQLETRCKIHALIKLPQLAALY